MYENPSMLSTRYSVNKQQIDYFQTRFNNNISNQLQNTIITNQIQSPSNTSFETYMNRGQRYLSNQRQINRSTSQNNLHMFTQPILEAIRMGNQMSRNIQRGIQNLDNQFRNYFSSQRHLETRAHSTNHQNRNNVYIHQLRREERSQQEYNQWQIKHLQEFSHPLNNLIKNWMILNRYFKLAQHYVADTQKLLKIIKFIMDLVFKENLLMICDNSDATILNICLIILDKTYSRKSTLFLNLKTLQQEKYHLDSKNKTRLINTYQKYKDNNDYDIIYWLKAYFKQVIPQADLQITRDLTQYTLQAILSTQFKLIQEGKILLTAILVPYLQNENRFLYDKFTKRIQRKIMKQSINYIQNRKMFIEEKNNYLYYLKILVKQSTQIQEILDQFANAVKNIKIPVQLFFQVCQFILFSQIYKRFTTNNFLCQLWLVVLEENQFKQTDQIRYYYYPYGRNRINYEGHHRLVKQELKKQYKQFKEGQHPIKIILWLKLYLGQCMPQYIGLIEKTNKLCLIIILMIKNVNKIGNIRMVKSILAAILFQQFKQNQYMTNAIYVSLTKQQIRQVQGLQNQLHKCLAKYYDGNIKIGLRT